VPVAARQERAQGVTGAQQLADRREIAVQMFVVTRFLHEAREQREVVHGRAVRSAVQVDAVAKRGAVRHDHAHAVVERTPQA